MSKSIYTPEQRLQCYKAMKEYLKYCSYRLGLCYAIIATSYEHHIFRSEGYDNKFIELPEIKKREPKDHGVRWFENSEEGRNNRLQILDEAIQEVSALIA